jgi:uncharacterized protein (UPF0332 family)
MSKVSPFYLEKARSNLVTMRLLWKLLDDKDARERLVVPAWYDPSEWVVICGYYAMYLAAAAILARVNYRSSNHTATIAALDELFVKKNMLEPYYLKMLEQAHLERKWVEHLVVARKYREIAQYSAQRTTSREIALIQTKNADAFVQRIEELLDLLNNASVEDYRGDLNG